MTDLLHSLNARQRALEALAATGRYDHPLWAQAARWAAPLGEGKYRLASTETKLAGSSDAELRTDHVVSTETQDRQGDVLLSKGVLPYLDRYKANPVWLWMHDQSQPVGLAASPKGLFGVHVGEKSIRASCWWHQHTQVSVQGYLLVRDGIVRGASVGWIPHQGEPGNPDAMLGLRGMKYAEWELCELTHCSVPANPDALREALSKSWDGQPLCDPIRRLLEPLAGVPREWAHGWPLAQPVESKCTECQGKGRKAVMRRVRPKWERELLKSVFGIRIKADGSAEDDDPRAEEEELSLGEKYVAGLVKYLNGVKAATDHPDVHGGCEKSHKIWSKIARKNSWKSLGYKMDDPDEPDEEEGEDKPKEEETKALAEMTGTLADLKGRMDRILGVA